MRKRWAWPSCRCAATSPVGFLEGLYVAPTWRRHGVARSLVEVAQAWCVECGCSEFASDALLDNAISHAVHRALGFAEAERVVHCVKPVRPR
jgi:aminoglycoside 6'-N-acetyltransferase I